MNTKVIIDHIKNKLKDYFNYIVILFLILLSISFFRNLVRIRESEEKLNLVEERVEVLKEENKDLQKDLEEVTSDSFIERQLRDKLGLAKEGDIVVVLPKEEVLRKLAPKREVEDEVLPDPNWKKWVRLFF